MRNSNEWAQESIGSINPDHLTFDDVPDLAPSPASPKSSCGGPKGSTGKAIKRRSRASKKAPTTLLTADANNFRALVQQFTGCHSATPLLQAYKGPINLNFEQCTYYPRKLEQKKQELADYEQQLLHDRLGHDESLCRSNNIDAAAAYALDDDNKVNGDRELFAASTDDQNPRSDALTYDHGLELPETADYEAMLDDEFWGY